MHLYVSNDSSVCCATHSTHMHKVSLHVCNKWDLHFSMETAVSCPFLAKSVLSNNVLIIIIIIILIIIIINFIIIISPFSLIVYIGHSTRIHKDKVNSPWKGPSSDQFLFQIQRHSFHLSDVWCEAEQNEKVTCTTGSYTRVQVFN